MSNKKSESWWNEGDNYLKRFLRNEKNVWLVYVCYAALLFWVIGSVIGMARSIYWIDNRYYNIGIVGTLLVIFISVFGFLLSTAYNKLSFYKTKRALLWISVISCCLCFIHLVGNLIAILTLPHVFALKITPVMTKGMVVSLGRIIMFFGYIIPVPLCVYLAKLLKDNEIVMERILIFRVKHLMDLRPDIEYQYDLKTIATDMETGKAVVIHEKDRYVHMDVNGASGSGKTSMVLLKQINEDLNTKVRNEERQKYEVGKLLKEGKLYLCRKPGVAFNINDFAAKEGCEEAFLDIKMRFRSAGITLVVPNDDVMIKACKLCEAKGIPYHRVDPHRTETGMKVKNWRGFNPLYIAPEKMEGADYNLPVIMDQKASAFRDVMNVLNDLQGGGKDVYFQGVNDTLTYNLTRFAMIVIPLEKGRQANPMDVRDMLASLDAIARHVKYYDEEVAKKDQGAIAASLRKNMEPIIKYIKNNLINNEKLRDKLITESNGLRNLMDQFLMNPLISTVLTAGDDETIDLDKCLEDGEVVFVNYSLDLGRTYATAFGLFYILNYKIAMLRRPGTEDTRIPNFISVDEVPVLLHPAIEDMISLFRQYRGAVTLLFQTYEQFARTDMTRYLKGVFDQCGTQFVFGRLSVEDMAHYEKMSGLIRKHVEEYNYSENSITADNAQATQGMRSQIREEASVRGTDMRYRDFQEVTLFTTRDGRALPGMHCRLSFLTDEDYAEVERKPFSYNGLEVISGINEDKEIVFDEDIAFVIDECMENNKENKSEPVNAEDEDKDTEEVKVIMNENTNYAERMSDEDIVLPKME